jgi:hypothetical protein
MDLRVCARVLGRFRWLGASERRLEILKTATRPTVIQPLMAETRRTA